MEADGLAGLVDGPEVRAEVSPVSAKGAKAKGTAAESAFRDHLRACGIRAERIPAGATHDRGDILAHPDWCLEVKHYTDTAAAVSKGLADLAVEQANAGTPYGAVVVRRRGKPDPADWAVVVPMSTLVRLMGGAA